jgi:predicted NBD/HSP70 family sugar kinase
LLSVNPRRKGARVHRFNLKLHCVLAGNRECWTDTIGAKAKARHARLQGASTRADVSVVLRHGGPSAKREDPEARRWREFFENTP